MSLVHGAGTPDPYESADLYSYDQQVPNGQPGQMSMMGGGPSMIPMYTVSQGGTAPYMMLVPMASNCMQTSNCQQSFPMQRASED